MYRILFVLIILNLLTAKSQASPATVLFVEGGFMRCVSDETSAIATYARRNGYVHVPGEPLMFARENAAIAYPVGKFTYCQKLCETMISPDPPMIVRKDCSKPYKLP